jgi:hypothetical protein
MRHPDELDEGLTAAPQVTALVPQMQYAPRRWVERQHAMLEHLHRAMQPAGQPCPELNSVWLQLRGDWSWVVMVPAEPDDSTEVLARELSAAGTRLSVYPVEFIEGTDLDLDGSSRLIAQLGMSARERGTWAPNGLVSSSYSPPITKSVVALDSPLANPLALPIARAADGVVLCVRRGRDRIASVRDTILAVGPDRILCCMLVD